MKDNQKIALEYPAGYSRDTSHLWPLPSVDENKMVIQLDEVTRESEEKAVEIFDIIDGIYNELSEKEQKLTHIAEVLGGNIMLLEKLSLSFPEVKAFGNTLQKSRASLEEANKMFQNCQLNGDALLGCMDIFQYQDIHRQKIERVVNVMRSLSNYMNNLLDGKTKDSNRASSALHIAGDNNSTLVSNDEIEALLAQFAS